MEQAILLHQPAHFLLAWCAKEAAYKWNGKKEVAFIEQLPITKFTPNIISILMPLHEARPWIDLEHLNTPEFACVYVKAINTSAI